MNISPLIGGGSVLAERFSNTILAAATAIFCCTLLDSPPSAQEAVDLTKLAAQLKNRDVSARRAAVDALIQRDDGASSDLLISALNDPAQEIRRDAALALGERGYVKAAERSSDCCKALMPVTGVSPSLRWVASEAPRRATRS
jgi:HEAT repeat protein